MRCSTNRRPLSELRTEPEISQDTSKPEGAESSSQEGRVTDGVRQLGVDLGSDAGGVNVQVDVILLVQAQVAVTQQVECVDTPGSRRQELKVKPTV